MLAIALLSSSFYKLSHSRVCKNLSRILLSSKGLIYQEKASILSLSDA